MERTARVVIGVETLDWPPIFTEDYYDEEEYPRSAQPGQQRSFSFQSRGDR